MTQALSSSAQSRKTVLVTGGTSRIGGAISHFLFNQGWNVIVHSQDYNKARLFTAQLQQTAEAFQYALPVAFNLQSMDSVDNALSTLASQLNGLDALVHNASTFFPTLNKNLTAEQWEQLMGCNASGPLFLTQALLPRLQEAEGSIVSILDIHALGQPYRNHVIYNMAKSAHMTMVLSLAKDLAPLVRVNAVAPGTILWPEKHHPGAIDAREQHDILSSIPLGRLGSPHDIAHAVNFLLEASYITGQIIRVDGGRALTIGGESY